MEETKTNDTDEVVVPVDEQKVFIEPIPSMLCGRCKREKVNGKCPACGRPCEYKEEYVQEVDKYLAECVDEVRDAEGDKLTVKLPTLEGFSLRLDKDIQTLKDWAKEEEKFSLALDKIHREQKKRIVEKGLSGQYNSTIAKLILSANHGMKEKSDVTTNDKEIGFTLLSLHNDADKDEE